MQGQLTISPASCITNGCRPGGQGKQFPAQLFADLGQPPGFWLDFTDLSTLFQDSAGSVPSTASNDPIGRVVDKSGNGNDFLQATTSKKAILSATSVFTGSYPEFDFPGGFVGYFPSNADEMSLGGVGTTHDVRGPSGEMTVIVGGGVQMGSLTYRVISSWEGGQNFILDVVTAGTMRLLASLSNQTANGRSQFGGWRQANTADGAVLGGRISANGNLETFDKTGVLSNLVATSNMDSGLSSPITISGTSDESGAYGAGILFTDIFLIGAALDQATITELVAFFNAKVTA